MTRSDDSTHDADRVEELFAAASELPAAEREALVVRECGADVAMRDKVLALLRADQQAGAFLARPTIEPNANIISTIEASHVVLTGSQAEGVGSIVGRYQLVSVLGQGTFGTVFLAEQFEGVVRQVALKRLNPGMNSEDVLARFEIDRQALAAMDHPNVVKVFDGGQTPNGYPYFVMELVRDAVPLTQYCNQHGLDVRARMELFMQACDGVQHAHTKGIIHRDLKPSNILVTVSEGVATVKVIDFGIAKVVGEPLIDRPQNTAFNAIVGTLEYMSPEQATRNASDIDARTDIYALGAVAYELLTGSSPLAEWLTPLAALEAILKTIREKVPPTPSTRRSSIGGAAPASRAPLPPIKKGDLDWIVMKALEKERARRYGTAMELARDVRRYLDHDVVEARPPSFKYRAGKFLRRHRFAVTAAAVIVLALVGGIIGTGWGLAQARRALLVKNQALVAEARQRQAANTERDAKEQARKSAEREAARANANAAESHQRQLEVERQLTEIEWAQYNSAISQARVDVESGDVARARNRLDSCRWDLRSWEHDHLAALVDGHTGVRRMALGLDDPRCAALSPDGAVIALCLKADNYVNGKMVPIPEIRLIDARTFATRRVISGDSHFTCVAFSGDGKQVLAGSEAGTLRAYDAATGELKLEWNSVAHFGGVAALAVSVDGKLVATAGVGGLVRLWNPSTAAEIRQLDGPFRKCVALTFSADNSTVAAIFADRAIHLWDSATGNPGAILPCPHGDLKCVALSPDGKYAVAGSSAGILYLWNARAGALAGLHAAGTVPITSIAFSPDGASIATGHGDGAVRLWDNKLADAPSTLLGHEGPIHDLFFTPNSADIVSVEGKLILSSPVLRIWSVASAAKRDGPFFSSTLRAAQFVPNGRYLTVDRDAKMTLWDLATRKATHSTRLTLPSPDSELSISPNGGTLAATLGRSVQILHLQSGAALLTLDCPAKPTNVVFDDTGRRALVHHDDNSVWAWDISGPKPSPLARFTDVPFVYIFTRKGRSVLLNPAKLATCAEYDVETGKKLSGLAADNPSMCQLSRDGSLLVTYGTTVTAWRRADDSAPGWIKLGNTSLDFLPTCFDFAPDGKRLFIGGMEFYQAAGVIVSWSMTSDSPPQLFRRYARIVPAVEFSPDGHFMTVVVGGLGANVIKDITVYDDGNLFHARQLNLLGQAGELAFDHAGSRLFLVYDNPFSKGTGLAAVDTTTGRFASPPTQGDICPHDPSFTSLSTSSDGGTLVTADEKARRLVCWDTRANRATVLLADLPAAPTRVRMSPDGARVAATCADHAVRVWNIAAKLLDVTLSLPGNNSLSRLAWSPDGATLAVIDGNSVALFDVARAARLPISLSHPKPVTSLAFTGDGHALVTGCADAIVRCWDPRTGAITATFTGHTAPIADVACRAQGGYAASVDSDGRVLVWDLARSSPAWTVAEPGDRLQPAFAVALCWAPDGQRLAAAGANGLTVWTLPVAAAIAAQSPN